MDNKMIELLKTIETLKTDELEKISAWIEFNLQKREKISLNDSKNSHNIK